MNLHENHVDGWDPLCRFYSLPHISELLVQTMPDIDVSSIIDLGAGSGTLSDAAGRRWHGAEVTTIDIDNNCGVAQRPDNGSTGRTHYTLDALDPDLVAKVSRGGAFDAAICNPPFRKIDWQDGYDQVLREAGLEHCFSADGDVTAEALFLAQNVRLVKHGGSIGLIVSDSFITGQTSAALRKSIVKSHHVRAVVQLPKRSFTGTDASSFLLVFTNKIASTSKIGLHRFSLTEGLSEAIVIDPNLAEHRLDYDFHAMMRDVRDMKNLSNLNAQIIRGRRSGAEIRLTSDFTFHTTDFAMAKNGEIFGPVVNCVGHVAQPGDILLARVDRALETKIAIVKEGTFPISDCVFIIRVPSRQQKKVFALLSSKQGRERLKAVSRGVGARHISKAELLAIPLY